MSGFFQSVTTHLMETRSNAISDGMEDSLGPWNTLAVIAGVGIMLCFLCSLCSHTNKYGSNNVPYVRV